MGRQWRGHDRRFQRVCLRRCNEQMRWCDESWPRKWFHAWAMQAGPRGHTATNEHKFIDTLWKTYTNHTTILEVLLDSDIVVKVWQRADIKFILIGDGCIARMKNEGANHLVEVWIDLRNLKALLLLASFISVWGIFIGLLRGIRVNRLTWNGMRFVWILKDEMIGNGRSKAVRITRWTGMYQFS